MSPPGNARPKRSTRMGETLLLGLTVGVAHTLAETTGAGWLGLSLTWMDVVFWTALYAVLGTVYAAALFAGARLLRSASAPPIRPAVSYQGRRLFFIGTWAAYGLTGTWLIIGACRGSPLLCILSLWAVVLTVLLALAGRISRSFPALVLGLLTLSFAAVGATLTGAMLNEVPLLPAKWKLGASTCLLPLLGLIILASSQRRAVALSPAGNPRGSLKRGALLPAVALAANLTLTAILWPVELGWHVDRPNPRRPAGAAGKPNVLLVVLDTVRARSLDLFGYRGETMPRLKRFAETECHHYAVMQANAPATLAAHAAMFTGHFSHSHGAHRPFLVDRNPPAYGYFLREDLPTLTEWLSGAGYRTAGIVANYGVLSSFGLRRGFGYYDVRPSDSKLFREINWLYAATTHQLGLRNRLGQLLPDRMVQAALSLDPWEPPFRSAEQLNERIFDWLEDHPTQPFFLFANYMEAHDPYLPPPRYRQRFGKRPPHITWHGFPEEHYLRAVYDRVPVPQADADFARSQYEAVLLYLDEQVDSLLQHLRALGRYDDTLIIILGDHGEGFNEHGLMRHGSTLYGPQIGVPLLIKFPASVGEPPAVSPHFQQVDLFTSILDLLGIEPPAGLQGRPWGAGRDYTLSEVFVRNRDSPLLNRELCALGLGHFKYIRSTTGQEELYNMAADPGESENLIDTRPELVARFRELLEQRNRRVTQRILRGREDRDLIERLRSLGYMH